MARLSGGGLATIDQAERDADRVLLRGGDADWTELSLQEADLVIAITPGALQWRLAITRHGPLWEAVGFSICLPVIAAPQVRGRELFVDGSLVDNLPVTAMAEMGEGPIIAVDVKPTLERTHNGLVAQVDGDRPRRPPPLGETLTRVLLLGSENTSQAAQRYADLVIEPRAEGVGLLEFHQLDAARDAGRAAARDALAQAPASIFA